MIVRAVTIGILAASLGSARAETLLLKDNASITGKILTTKRDTVVVDLGFTVINVPKNAVVKVSSDESLAITKKSDRSARVDKSDKPDKSGKSDKTGHSEKSDPADTAALSKRQPATSSEGDSSLFQTGLGSSPERSVRDLVSQLGEAVVQVRTPGGLGSGFFLNEEGYLITNFHVIEGETQISIEVYHQKDGPLERKVYKQVRIIAMNKFQDLALLKVDDKEAPRFAFVPLGESDQLAVGERVFAIGSPLGLERTVTEGIVSTKTRQFQGALYLQTTTQINPGNSGGPLFNLRGEVTGVTNMKIFGEGIGFAIPVENVKYFLKHRDAYAYETDNPSNPYRYLEPPSRLLSEAAAKAKLPLQTGN